MVADASAVLEFLIGSARGQAVERLLVSTRDRVHAPALLDAEVAQALRRLTASGVVTESRGAASVELLQALPLQRHPMTPLLPRIWALRANLTAYDASYVSLAETLRCPLVTFDMGIADAPGHRARVVVPE